MRAPADPEHVARHGSKSDSSRQVTRATKKKGSWAAHIASTWIGNGSNMAPQWAPKAPKLAPWRAEARGGSSQILSDVGTYLGPLWRLPNLII